MCWALHPMINLCCYFNVSWGRPRGQVDMGRATRLGVQGEGKEVLQA